MKLVQINTTCGIGSTGKICVSLSKLLSEKQIENYIIFSSQTDGYSLGISCATSLYTKGQAVKSKIYGNYGFNSLMATSRMIKALEKIKPDVVHLHNIHGHDCNIDVLCEYLKKKNIKVFWTFHDCWMFTGYCSYFTLEKCDKWKESCNSCGLHKKYSYFFDRSTELYERKKRALLNLDLTIITPSQWLADVLKQSFLKEYPVKVINNGIDLDIFKPTESDFRSRYNLENKKIVLGVAYGWGKRKGLDAFIELSKRLTDEYKIVLVGTDSSIDRVLPQNILSIHRTSNQKELAQIYSSAEVFVNPTREDNFPTTNLESLACGTPVITFRTGGSPECVTSRSGIIVEVDDIAGLKQAVSYICENKPFSVERCVDNARHFDMYRCYEEYITMYDIDKY